MELYNEKKHYCELDLIDKDTKEEKCKCLTGLTANTKNSKDRYERLQTECQKRADN